MSASSCPFICFCCGWFTERRQGKNDPITPSYVFVSQPPLHEVQRRADGYTVWDRDGGFSLSTIDPERVYVEFKTTHCADEDNNQSSSFSGDDRPMGTGMDGITESYFSFSADS